MDHNKETSIYSSHGTESTKSGFYSYVLSKLERLTNGVYLVTNFLSDMEPVKWKIRELCLDVVSDKNLGNQFSDSLKSVALDNVTYKLRNLLKMLDTVSATGAVSEMNIAILKQEYQKVLSSLEEEALSSMSRYVSHLLPPPVPPSTDVKSGPVFVRQNLPGAPSSITDRRIESIRPVSSTPHKEKASAEQSDSSQDEAKAARKNQITQYLEGKAWTSIKDIATEIKGCSRKTVQRDLVELVDQGVLHKRGERRWSRYVLAK